MVAVLAKVLRHRYRIGYRRSKFGIQIPDPCGVGAHSRHHAHSRWIADGELTICSLKSQARSGQPIEIGRQHFFHTIAPQFPAQVIHGNKQDIGLVSGHSKILEEHAYSRNQLPINTHLFNSSIRKHDDVETLDNPPCGASFLIPIRTSRRDSVLRNFNSSKAKKGLPPNLLKSPLYQVLGIRSLSLWGDVSIPAQTSRCRFRQSLTRLSVRAQTFTLIKDTLLNLKY